MIGTVFNIQRFSVNDGPGIRTTVFLKGCPLDCIWCHNPESKSPSPELSFDAKSCVECGTCLDNCPSGCHRLKGGIHTIDRRFCRLCGSCTRDCAGGALEIIGKECEAADVIEDVFRDAPFFKNSGGGMTISGGEPLFQPEFTLELLRLAKAKEMNTAIETSGFAGWKCIEAIIPYTDCFLFDIKETDGCKHLQFTGAPLAPILENLRHLDDSGASIILRCPLIPDYNVRAEHFIGIAELADTLKNVKQIELEPYHPLGASKACNIGKMYAVANDKFTDKSFSEAWLKDIRKRSTVPVRLA